jgi:precorrin-2 dehydrogenase/sirohydrochlorin ferrochelatase
LHDFAGERVLVFGGGSVGLRKAAGFADEAEVVVVSPTFDEHVSGVELVRACPTASTVEGTGTTDATDAVDEEDVRDREGGEAMLVADWMDRTTPALVVAATDDATVNAAVERAARERNVLVNRADESGERDAGSVVVPATVRDGPVLAAVATGGLSPALSARLRKRIEPEIEGAGRVAETTADLRGELRERPPETRRDALRAVVASDRVWRVAREGGDVRDVRAIAERVVTESFDG